MSDSSPFSAVLLSDAAHPDPVAVIDAARGLGIELALEMGDPNNLTFRVNGGGQMIIALMPGPHPDATTMPLGPTSPPPAILEEHRAHYIIAGFGLSDGDMLSEVAMGIMTAAVIRSSPAVAAMHGYGAIFHRADVFAGAVEAAGTDIPTEITVDITAAQEGADRMSFLTHGLQRYGREEFYVTSSVTGTGALEYVMALARWMVIDRDKVLPTGDTVGRTADEKIIVQRVPSPIEGNKPVIRLDMDLDEPKKKSLFSRK